MTKKILWLVILIVIIGGMLIAINWPLNFWPFVSQSGNQSNNQANNQSDDLSDQVQVVEGITVYSPTAGQEVSSPIKITGKVNGAGWNGFEGQVGSVTLLDANGNVLTQSPLTATTDWMQPEISFETTLTLDNGYKGVATLLFKNENASGDPERERRFGLPIVVK